MSKKTKSAMTTTSERKSVEVKEMTKKVQKMQDGGYNPETWTQEWVRKNEEAKKLKRVSRPVDILPACENDVTEAEDHGKTE